MNVVEHHQNEVYIEYKRGNTHVDCIFNYISPSAGEKDTTKLIVILLTLATRIHLNRWKCGDCFVIHYERIMLQPSTRYGQIRAST